MVARPMGGYKTRPYDTRLQSSRPTHTHVVAGFIPASRVALAGRYKTRPYDTKLRSSHITHTHVVAGFIPASQARPVPDTVRT